MKKVFTKQLLVGCLVLNAILTQNLAGQNPVEPICINPSIQYYPSFYGDRIVWQDFRYGNLDIFMYDLQTDTEIPVCTTSSPQMNPVIWGDRIVWHDRRGEDWDIYMYYIPSGTVTPICTTAEEQSYPVICGDIIVWQDQRDGNYDIYMDDLTTKQEKAVCTDKSDQKNPTIWGKRILWEDNRNGNWDIYMRYLNYFTYSDPPQDLEVFALSLYIDLDYDTPSNQIIPKISGNTLAYEDDRTGMSKIYTYHFHNQL